MNGEGENEQGMWEAGWITLPSNMDFGHRNCMKYFRMPIAFQGIPIVSYRAHPFIPVVTHFCPVLTPYPRNYGDNGGVNPIMTVLIP
jgi:hypothetical protein